MIAVAKFAERNQSYCVMYIDESVHVLHILNMIDKDQYLISIQSINIIYSASEVTNFPKLYIY